MSVTRVVRNVSAAIFFIVALWSSPVFGKAGSCPPELTGQCLSCVWTENGYWYNSCEEDCAFNEALCNAVCGGSGTDQCHQSNVPPITCGECTCNLSRPGGPRIPQC